MIRLKKISVNGFKNLDVTNLEFPKEGNILVIGHNESGKSTLFEAVFFALTSKLLIKQSGRRGFVDAIAFNKEMADIQLWFYKDNRYCRIRKEISRSGSGSSLHCEFWTDFGTEREEYREGSRGDVDPIIEEFVGFNEEVLKNSSYVEQKGLDGFINETKSTREAIVSKILNLDKLTYLIADYHEKVRETKKIRGYFKENVNLEKAIQERDSNQQKQKLLKENKEKIEILENFHASIDSFERQTKQKEPIVEKNLKEIKKNVQSIEQFQQKNQKLEKNKSTFQKIQQIKSQIEDQKKQNQVTSEQIKQTQAKIQTLKNRKQEHQKLVEKKKKTKTKLSAVEEEKENLVKMEGPIGKIRDMVEREKSYRKNLDSVNKEIGSSKTFIQKNHKEIQKTVQQRIQSLENLLKEQKIAQEEIASSGKKVENCNDAVRCLETSKEQMQTILDLKNDELQKTQSTLQLHQGSLKELKEKQSKVKLNLEKIEEIDEKKADREEEKKDLNKKLTVRKNYNSLKCNKQKLLKENQSAELRISEITDLINEKKTAMENNNKSIQEDINRRKENIENLSQKIENLEYLAAHFDKRTLEKKEFELIQISNSQEKLLKAENPNKKKLKIIGSFVSSTIAFILTLLSPYLLIPGMIFLILGGYFYSQKIKMRKLSQKRRNQISIRFQEIRDDLERFFQSSAHFQDELRTELKNTQDHKALSSIVNKALERITQEYDFSKNKIKEIRKSVKDNTDFDPSVFSEQQDVEGKNPFTQKIRVYKDDRKYNQSKYQEVASKHEEILEKSELFEKSCEDKKDQINNLENKRKTNTSEIESLNKQLLQIEENWADVEDFSEEDLEIKKGKCKSRLIEITENKKHLKQRNQEIRQALQNERYQGLKERISNAKDKLGLIHEKLNGEKRKYSQIIENENLTKETRNKLKLAPENGSDLISEIKKTLKNHRDHLEKLRNEHDNISKQVIELKSKIENEINDFGWDMGQNIHEYEKIQINLQRVLQILNQLQSEVMIGHLDQLRQHCKFISRDVEDLKEKIRHLQSTKKEKTRVSAELKELETEIPKRSKEIPEKYRGKFDEFQRRKEQLEKELTQVQTTLQNTEDRLKEFDMKELTKRLGELTPILEAQIEKRENSISKISKNREKTNELKEKIDDEFRDADFKKISKNIQQNVQNLREKNSKASERIKSNLSELIRQCNGFESKLKSISALEINLPEDQTVSEQLNDFLAGLNTPEIGDVFINRASSYSNVIQTISPRLRSIKNAILRKKKELVPKTDSFDNQVKIDKKYIEELIEKQQKTLGQIDEKIKASKDEMKKYRKNANKWKKIKPYIQSDEDPTEIEERFKKDFKKLKYVEAILKESKNRIERKVLPKTRMYLSKILPILTANRYKDAKIDEDYRIQIYDSKMKGYVEKSLFSGGTNDQIALALRLGFALATMSEERSKESFIFLDEPLGFFDDERRYSFIDFLTNGIISNIFSQRIVVSNFRAIKQYFDYVIEIENGRIISQTQTGTVLSSEDLIDYENLDEDPIWEVDKVEYSSEGNYYQIELRVKNVSNRKIQKVEFEPITHNLSIDSGKINFDIGETDVSQPGLSFFKDRIEPGDIELKAINTLQENGEEILKSQNLSIKYPRS